MRLIDGNKALREVERIPFIANENKAFHEGCRYMQKKVLRIFHESKAIEAKPVKHGRWEHLGGDEWYCTNCGEVISTEGSWDKPTYKHCHECGAKMDGGAENA